MEIGSGDDCLSSAQRVRQSAGNNLALMFVWRDINIGCPDQFNQFSRANESVAKDYVVFDAQFLRQILQVGAVPITFTPQDVRMGHSGDHVNDIAVVSQNLWQGLDYVFDAFIG